MNIKFISLNIWQGGNMFVQSMEFLYKENPDILVVQEVYDGQNPLYEQRYKTFLEVKKTLSFSYSSFSPAFLDTRTIGNIDRGNAIFSKFPIISNTTIAYDRPYGSYDEEHDMNYQNVPMCLQHAVVLIHKNEYNIYNLQGIWGKDGRDNPRRIRMGKFLVEETKNRKRVVLAGDFNLNPNTETIRGLEKCLRNVFKNKLKTTFNMKQKKNPALAKSIVDMIFVSRDLKIVDYSCPDVNISDHLPLICALEIEK